ncbi:MAG: hypothetical protein WCC95_18545 [Candidatus Sulfotelmatobacter sp.]
MTLIEALTELLTAKTEVARLEKRIRELEAIPTEERKLRDRVRELEAELKIRPMPTHGLEKYINPDANTRPLGSDAGALSIQREGFVSDNEENPVQVNYEVDHR